MRRFSVSHLKDTKFARRGLRSYFEYRDLGIRRASGGKVVAHVIRARPGSAPHGEWHLHDCEVQLVYVLKGWVRFEYEGVGEVHSPDVEMLEVVAPAAFKTLSAEKPAARTSPARRSRG